MSKFLNHDDNKKVLIKCTVYVQNENHLQIIPQRTVKFKMQFSIPLFLRAPHQSVTLLHAMLSLKCKAFIYTLISKGPNTESQKN
jgi:hypothetical protein